MKKVCSILFLLIILFALKNEIQAQIQFDLENSYYLELPNDTIIRFRKEKFRYVGGFSGITQADNKNKYYLISDSHKNIWAKGDAVIIETEIKFNNGMQIEFTDKKSLPMPEIWPESIRRTSQGTIYITEERTIKRILRTYLYELRGSLEMNKIELPEEFHDNLRYNSGFEGLAVSKNEEKLYLCLERPKIDAADKSYTKILEIKLNTSSDRFSEFLYPFQRKIKGTGLTELLTVNDSILLVLERDYADQRNFVSLYSVNINDYDLKNEKERILKPVKIFSFDDVQKIGNKDFKVNNIEGMTFSSDNQYLIFISDNNFGNKCRCTPTQVIALKIKTISYPF